MNADLWCLIKQPDGSWYGPVLGPLNLALPPGYTISRHRTQLIPGTFPSGECGFYGFAGNYSGVISVEDGFPFTKLPSGTGPSISDWSNTGETFPGENRSFIVGPSTFVLSV